MKLQEKEVSALLSVSWQMLICFSYYGTPDLPQWTELLAQLNDKIEASHTHRPNRTSGNVLLMGSPMYFPNYKIPFLLQDVGLHVAAHLDYTTRRAVTALTIEETADITLSGLGQRFYQADCSGSYAKKTERCKQRLRNCWTAVTLTVWFTADRMAVSDFRLLFLDVCRKDHSPGAGPQSDCRSGVQLSLQSGPAARIKLLLSELSCSPGIGVISSVS